jgi:NAD(P)-dependent dehydrogenase (short-subunit alcohol dehydrogenase family)
MSCLLGICDGRVVIVSGAAKGLGRAYPLMLAREGARVVVNNRVSAGSQEVDALIDLIPQAKTN